jgi:hypothetical protein
MDGAYTAARRTWPVFVDELTFTSIQRGEHRGDFYIRDPLPEGERNIQTLQPGDTLRCIQLQSQQSVDCIVERALASDNPEELAITAVIRDKRKPREVVPTPHAQYCRDLSGLMTYLRQQQPVRGVTDVVYAGYRPAA